MCPFLWKREKKKWKIETKKSREEKGKRQKKRGGTRLEKTGEKMGGGRTRLFVLRFVCVFFLYGLG